MGLRTQGSLSTLEVSVTRPVRREGSTAVASAPSLRLPGIILGVGLGGFVDGIVLHQLLQWHHMLTSAATARIHVGS
jgi:hypothetical protein